MVNFDVVIPNNNEEDFLEIAESLGYTEIVFLTSNFKYVKPFSKRNISIKTAYIIKDVSEINKARKTFDYIFATADRKYFESKVDFIIDSELSDRKDSFHYKATFLNQVHAVLARDNRINIVFSFSNLLISPQIVFGKMCQNAVLVKKYKIRHSSFSLAEQPTDMRSRTILDALLSVIGSQNSKL